MTFPTGPVTVPDVVDRIADGRDVTAVWVNELGGITFSVDAGAEFVKVYPDEHAHLLAAEAPRLRWTRRFATVPEVVASGPGWLHTRGLPGRSARSAARRGFLSIPRLPIAWWSATATRARRTR